MSNLRWLNPNYDKVLMEDLSLVNMEIDKLKEENEQLHNKVSELTEALDASHIFCEGVKAHYIKKACVEFCAHCNKHSMCLTMNGYATDTCSIFQSFKQSLEE